VDKLSIKADEVLLRRQRGNSKKGADIKFAVGYEGKIGRKERLKNYHLAAGVTDGTGIWEKAGCDFGKKWDPSKVKQVYMRKLPGGCNT